MFFVDIRFYCVNDNPHRGVNDNPHRGMVLCQKYFFDQNIGLEKDDGCFGTKYVDLGNQCL